MKLEDWLIAEATRRGEETDDRYRLDDAATRNAARLNAPVRERIVARAKDRPEGARLAEEIANALALLRGVAVGWLLLGTIAGAAAAANLRTSGDTIALSYALLALLGIPLLLLLASLLIGLFASRLGGAGLPGRIAWRLARRPGGPAARGQVAAALAELGRLGGRRLMAAVSHGFWAAFFVGCIAWSALLFLGLRFDFSWETTLLSGPWVGDLIVALGTPPAWLFGMELPDAEQVRAALIDRSAPADRRLWAAYLIGALALYGLFPRALLAAVSLWRWRRLRLELDLGRTGYLRLLPALAGSSTAAEPDGPPPEEDGTPAVSNAGAARGGAGAPVAVGFELDEFEPAWPPNDPQLRVLGRADDRQQRRQIEQALRVLDPLPAAIVVHASLARTPDRGTGHWLVQLNRIAPVHLRLLPAAGSATREPGTDARRRDWEALCRRFGLTAPRTGSVEDESASPAAEH